MVSLWDSYTEGLTPVSEELRPLDIGIWQETHGVGRTLVWEAGMMAQSGLRVSQRCDCQ